MKYKNKIQIISLLLVFFTFTSCNESLEIGQIDEDLYTTDAHPIAYIADEQAKQNINYFEFQNEGVFKIHAGLTKLAESNAVITLKYDPAVLSAYNDENETQYTLLPENLVQFNGELTIQKDSKMSDMTSIIVTTDNALNPDLTYAIPLSAQVTSGNIELADKESKYILLVKDKTSVPTADKESGIKIVSCMEVNDANPLNNLCFTLKESGKPLIDQVILFSSNINYNNETGEVYVFHNPNVQHLLDYRDKYIKPLQDRGIKVLLSILGNHDRSGVANLADETARAFAKEIKATCDAYGLDGVFFDDEYSAYQSPIPAGFVSPSSDAAARLIYETKQVMPDKIVSVYVWSTTAVLPAVDGVESGNFVDYALHDYGKGYDLSTNYPGMERSQMGVYSQEFNRGYWASTQSLETIREDGYGAHMIFAMDPFRLNFGTQLSQMKDIAKVLFDEELVYDNNPYRKDW